MLVLTRNIGKSIIIGDDVEIIVLEVRGGQVRLGINAPRNIPVHRKEIYDQIKEKAAQESQSCAPPEREPSD